MAVVSVQIFDYGMQPKAAPNLSQTNHLSPYSISDQDIVLVAPEAEDIPHIARLATDAFDDMICWPLGSREKDVKTNTKGYKTMLKDHPPKFFDHCRIAIHQGYAHHPRQVLGVIQLQVGDDVGDLRIREAWRHKCRDDYDAYVEWIGTDPKFTGKGIGKRLLAWAHDYCDQERR